MTLDLLILAADRLRVRWDISYIVPCLIIYTITDHSLDFWISTNHFFVPKQHLRCLVSVRWIAIFTTHFKAACHRVSRNRWNEKREITFLHYEAVLTYRFGRIGCSCFSRRWCWLRGRCWCWFIRWRWCRSMWCGMMSWRLCWSIGRCWCWLIGRCWCWLISRIWSKSMWCGIKSRWRWSIGRH